LSYIPKNFASPFDTLRASNFSSIFDQPFSSTQIFKNCMGKSRIEAFAAFRLSKID